MQTLAPPRADSPNNHTHSHQYKPPQHSTDPFAQGSQNNTTHAMYNSMNSIGLPSSDYSLSPAEPDALNFSTKVNGSFASAPFRTSTAFTQAFANRQRHTAPFRDTSSNFASSAYPPTNELFGGVQNSMSHMTPSQSQLLPHGLETLHHPPRGFDPSAGSQVNGGVPINGISQSKQLSFGSEIFRQGYDSTPTLLQQKPSGGVTGGQGLLQNGQAIQLPHQSNGQAAFHGSFTNGLGNHSLGHGPLAQPQYGAGPPGGVQGNGTTSAPNPNPTNGPVPNSQAQEEISTIFVVGFPDDMSEREFQNMFTFSSGFEAATLKIPNKESTSYANSAGQNGRAPGLSMPFGGSNDPYNLVTMNQGGVLIDGGRDGSMTSWPVPSSAEDGHFVQSNMPMQPPRKQIIGFAKFRTRADALQARDVLQGRRVDVEKGAVLKAEMAKKNLHTKRGPGVGPAGLPAFQGGIPGAGAPDNLSGMQGLTSPGEALAPRDKQPGALNGMGVDINGFAHRRDRLFDGRDDEDRERRRDFASLSLGGFNTRGPRERAEEDERERERKRREKEKEATRLRQNSFAFEAFHSVPQQMVRQGTNSVLSAESGMGLPSEGLTSPWGNLRDVSASAALRKMGLPQHHLTGLPARPQSPPGLQTSPPMQEALANLSVPFTASSQNGSVPGSRSAQFSPESNPASLPMHPSLPTRPRPQSPSSEPQPHQNLSGPFGQISTSLPNSATSSVSGSQSGHEDELVKSVGALAVSTQSGSTSPQLPSPASGASSGTGRSGSDHNPPINTLYVGNLPTSTSPGGYTLSFLEDRLRDLFSKQLGYRKLCFRQKSNGPMCFIEFETVEYATKALNELYGDSLNGLVRNGGIRLSYSKNPLGVRTPNSGGSGPSLQQQQQLSREPLQEANRDFGEIFARHTDSADTIRAIRRDTSGMTSPTSSYHYTTSPPPPRFFSPPPGVFNGVFPTSTSFPRANPQGYGLGSSSSSTFSPFGIPHSSIPDQPSAEASSNDHIAHPLTPAAANVEASLVG
ncbi:uncharacterized protein TRAVEDRAFT_34908 [Trametes versicolor FP-101664 SS1]|uniref:uncharacterized protein n=1 Tax=Trametes versicolor (strain FP-101664) TaxID=717944 RepID=UPI0004622E48|nr:uncharacterized protein TRAVEDRAFT_34908 [Trametes versicolor FP-101664 SS1]EIW61406.1 hypothetical protein TRAVEDRAFT_34908 [Trametes versicolor FP-101664 SS1]